MELSELKVHGSTVKTYYTNNLTNGLLAEGGVRGRLVQAPGAQQAWFETDGVDEAREFSVEFGVKADSKLEALFKLGELRALLNTATSIEHVNTGFWRALIGGRSNVGNRLPNPIFDNDLSVWVDSVVLRPKFGRWTYGQAETLSTYLTNRDLHPTFTQLQITTASLPAATRGQNYSQQLAATGGNGGAITWFDAGSLRGINISSSGLVTWTPALGDVGEVIAAVTDGTQTIYKRFSIAITGNEFLTHDNIYLTDGGQFLTY